MRNINDDTRLKHIRYIDKFVMDQVYTLLPSEFRVQIYRECFLSVDKIVNL